MAVTDRKQFKFWGCRMLAVVAFLFLRPLVFFDVWFGSVDIVTIASMLDTLILLVLIIGITAAITATTVVPMLASTNLFTHIKDTMKSVKWLIFLGCLLLVTVLLYLLLFLFVRVTGITGFFSTILYSSEWVGDYSIIASPEMMTMIIVVSIALVVFVNVIARSMTVNQRSNLLNTYLARCCSCVLWGVVMCFLGFMILVLGAIEFGGNDPVVIGFSMLGIVPGLVLLIIVLVYQMMLLYQLWKLIPTDIARTTPSKAVGYTFIPFFAFYWIFVAYIGLAEDMNKTLRKHGIQYQVNEGLGVILCVLLCVGYFLPPIYIACPIIAIYFFKSIVGGATALLEQGKSERVDNAGE